MSYEYSEKSSGQHLVEADIPHLFDVEQSSYSAMLNIAESIPPPESIPPIPELHPTQFRSIPESQLLIPSNSGIE